jgi:hypothetical protein
MQIINQDGERLTIKRAYSRKHCYEGKFMGWNMYGETHRGERLLGTFDTEKVAEYAERTVNYAIETGLQAYVMSGAGIVEEALYYAEKANRLIKTI